MANFGQRLKIKREEKGYSLAALGKLVGVSASSILKWERDDTASLKANNIFKLANVLNTTPGYLMGWEDDLITNIPNVERLPEFIPIPLLGTIACGKPIDADENIEAIIAMPKGIRANFALRCKGDSMILARIYDGDLVFIKQQPQVENGEIAAVLIDNEATLKRFYKFPDHVELRPENPRFQTLVYTPEECADLRILGKAVAFVAPVR